MARDRHWPYRFLIAEADERMHSDRIKYTALKHMVSEHRVRWLMLLVVILVFTALLYPGLVVTDLTYRVGDVAERDIKASRDFLIEDRQATEANQRKAAEQTLTVYDYDVLLSRNLTNTIDQVFRDMRSSLAEREAKEKLNAAAVQPANNALTLNHSQPAASSPPAPPPAGERADGRSQKPSWRSKTNLAKSSASAFRTTSTVCWWNPGSPRISPIAWSKSSLKS